MSLSIAVVTDPHVHGLLFWSKLEVLEQALSGPEDLVVIAGDLAHNARMGDDKMSTFHQVRELSRVLNVSKPVVLLEGNHDQFGTRGSALDLFHLPNLTKVADRCEYFGFQDTEIVCIPWIRGRANWKELVLAQLNNIPGTKKHRLIIGHMNILDAVQNKTMRVNPDDHFVFSVEELKQTAFAPTALICGHLHERQRLMGINGCYGGAMTQNNFGEDGNPMSYVIFRDGQIEFKDVVAPQFRNVLEEDFDGTDTYNYYKFQTANPERYSGFANVKCTGVEDDVEAQVNTSAFDGKIELNKLIEDFCRESKLEVPPGDLVQEELEKISLCITRNQTGLDQIDHIHLVDFGPDKDTILIENKRLTFQHGLTAIVGINGKGKTLALESLLAGLYGSYVERGALKNYCHGCLSLGLRAQGNVFEVVNEPCKKGGLVAHVNDVYCKTRADLATQIEPVFGSSNVFDSVVFMDQGAKKDLVMAGETKALEILSKMLNLDILEDRRKEYAKQAKAYREEALRIFDLMDKFQEIEAQQALLREQLDKLTPPDPQEIETLRKQLAYQVENEEIRKKAEEWFECLQFVEQNQQNPELVEAIQDRQKRLWLAEADLKYARDAYQGKAQAGCAPNFLPCRFLVRYTEQDIQDKEDLVASLQPQPEHQEILQRHEAAERAKARAEVLFRDKRIQDTRVIYEAPEVLRLRLQLLEQNAQNYKNLRTSLDLQNASMTRVQANIEKAERADLLYQQYDFLETLCSKKGLSLYVISSIVGGLQAKLNELTRLADVGLRIRVSLSKAGDESLDQFRIEYSRHGRPFAKAIPCSSGGERVMIQVLFKLALMLYLNDYFGNYKVLIMDEPEKGLDKTNVDVLINLLRILKYRLNQVIVVTHDDRITQVADQVIEF